MRIGAREFRWFGRVDWRLPLRHCKSKLLQLPGRFLFSTSVSHPFPKSRKEKTKAASEENCYGAMYFKRFFSSSRDSFARVRMCIITVPVIRGERLMGA